jgi:hypothetical protein
MNLEQLREKLNKAVPFVSLESDSCKNDALKFLDKVNRLEMQFVMREHRPTCVVKAVAVDITHRLTKNIVLHLRENRRVHQDGTIVVCQDTDGIGLKILLGERPEDAAKRCLMEKLRFSPVPQVSFIDKKEDQTRTRAPFPCKIMIVQLYRFGCVIPKDLYNPNGYSQERNGKNRVSNFIWAPKIEVQKKAMALDNN